MPGIQPSTTAVEEAQRVVKAVGALVPEPLYMRVDGVYLGKVFYVTEIEGVEPYLKMSKCLFSKRGCGECSWRNL